MAETRAGARPKGSRSEAGKAGNSPKDPTAAKPSTDFFYRLFVFCTGGRDIFCVFLKQPTKSDKKKLKRNKD